MKKHLLTVCGLIATMSLAAAPAFAAESSQPAKDSLITGKLEATYLFNRHLAGEIAKGAEGVTSVKNDLVVKAGSSQASTKSSNASGESFGQYVDDATTTAMVK